MNAVPLAPALAVPFADDDHGRLTALFDTHYERLYRLARRLAPSADAARDLVQETFLRAAGSRRTIPCGARDEEAWLVRVLVNVQRDEWRKSDVRRRHLLDATRTTTMAGADPEAALVARATVRRAVGKLPPRRRAVVILHELEELGVSEIAALLGIRAVTVRWHLSRGRRELARLLGAASGEHHVKR